MTWLLPELELGEEPELKPPELELELERMRLLNAALRADERRRYVGWSLLPVFISGCESELDSAVCTVGLLHR